MRWPPARAGGAAHRCPDDRLAGDHIVAARNLYGGTYTQFDVTLRKMGIVQSTRRSIVSGFLDRAVSERTELIWETIGNPR